MGAKHAKWFVTSAKTTGWLRETELVPKTQGIVNSIKEMKFAMGLLRHGRSRRPSRRTSPPRSTKRASSTTSSRRRGRDGALGIVQGEHALERIEFYEKQKEAAEE